VTYTSQLRVIFAPRPPDAARRLAIHSDRDPTDVWRWCSGKWEEEATIWLASRSGG